MNAPMDRAWAQAAAVLGRSWLGSRAGRLLASRNLAELVALACPELTITLPDKLLVPRLQAAAAARGLAETLRVLGRPAPGPLAVQIGAQEYRWLKLALAEQAEGRALPSPPQLGAWARLRLGRWPDLAAMVQGSVYRWLPREPATGDLVSIGRRLDRQYWQEMLGALASWPADDAMAGLLRRELALRNAAWVLRLRFIFGLGRDGTDDWLIGRGPQFRQAAEEAWVRPADDPRAWADWRFAAFLPPAAAGVDWRPDPAVFERRALSWLMAAMLGYFHAEPLSAGAILAFCRLKAGESELVSSVAEGLLLGLGGTTMASLVPWAGGAA